MPTMGRKGQAEALGGKSKGKGRGRGRGTGRGKSQDPGTSNVKQQHLQMGTGNARNENSMAQSAAAQSSPAAARLAKRPPPASSPRRVLSLSECLAREEDGRNSSSQAHKQEVGKPTLKNLTLPADDLRKVADATSSPQTAEIPPVQRQSGSPLQPRRLETSSLTGEGSSHESRKAEDASAVVPDKLQEKPPCGPTEVAVIAGACDGQGEELAQEPEPEIGQPDDDISPRHHDITCGSSTQCESCDGSTVRSMCSKLKDMVVFGIGGAAVLGVACSLLCGFIGCCIGALCGSILSALTFGISIPVGMTVGGSVCFGIGLTFGCAVGFLLGSSLGYFAGKRRLAAKTHTLLAFIGSLHPRFRSLLGTELGESMDLFKEKSV